MTWTASTDNVGVAGYRVYRGTTAGFTPAADTLRGTVAGTTFEDVAPPPGTFYYKVVAFDGADDASAAAAASAPVTVVDGVAPSVPTGVNAVAAGQAADISWTASTDNAGVTGYALLYRGSDAGFVPSMETLIQPNIAGTSYHDAPLSEGTSYYKVTARDAAGNVSGASSAASVVIVAPDEHAAERARGTDGGRRRRQQRHPELECLDGQRRCHRVPRLPRHDGWLHCERRFSDRRRGGDDLHRQRSTAGTLVLQGGREGWIVERERGLGRRRKRPTVTTPTGSTHDADDRDDRRLDGRGHQPDVRVWGHQPDIVALQHDDRVPSCGSTCRRRRPGRCSPRRRSRCGRPTIRQPDRPTSTSSGLSAARGRRARSPGTTVRPPPPERRSSGSLPGATALNSPYIATLSAADLAPLAGTSITLATVQYGQGSDNVRLWSREATSPDYRPTLTLTYTTP